MTGLQQDRFISLDVFRGITIAGMVLVNNPGDWSYVYAPMRHAEWHGWTLTDLVFPFFLFIVGVSMVFSIQKGLRNALTRESMVIKAIRRSAILFGLGIALYLVPTNIPEGYSWFRDTLLQVRIMGVLQRIALVYFIVSLLVLYFDQKGRIIWALGLLAVYWLAMRFVPVPVVQDGVATTHIGSYEREINLAAFVDNALLYGHTYLKGSFFHHDPEGILSTLPAIVTALIGVETGMMLRTKVSEFQKASLLFFAGSCGILLGLVLDSFFPINKSLWSPSYVILTGGLGLTALGMCYYLVEIKGIRFLVKPFVVLGTNAITLYVCSELIARLILLISVDVQGTSVKSWLFDRVYLPALGHLNGSLAFAIAYLLVMFGFVSILYRNRILIRV